MKCLKRFYGKNRYIHQDHIIVIAEQSEMIIAVKIDLIGIYTRRFQVLDGFLVFKLIINVLNRLQIGYWDKQFGNIMNLGINLFPSPEKLLTRLENTKADFATYR